MRTFTFYAALVLGTTSAFAQSCDDVSAFKSDEGGIYAWLENEQRLLYEGNPQWVNDPLLREQLNDPTRAKTLSDLLSEFMKLGCNSANNECFITEEDAKQIRAMISCESIPTRFESPITFNLIKLALGELESAIVIEYPAAPEINYGTYPTNTIQAVAVTPLGYNVPIIVLNRDVFHLTGKLSKAVSAAIPIKDVGDNVALSIDREEIRRHIRENPWIAQNFAAAMFLLVTREPLGAAPEQILDAHHNLLHARLVAGLDSFIIGHEVGHVVLGHRGNTRLYAFPPAQVGASNGSAKEETVVSLLDYDGNQELAADAVALRLFVKAAMEGTAQGDGGISAAIGAAGGDLFFAVIDLVDKYATLIGTVPMHDTNHPPAVARSANLDKVFQSDDMKAYGIHRLPDFRVMTRAAFAVLADETEPFLIMALERYRRSAN